MFKVGDRVRVVEHSNYQRHPINMSCPIGSEHEIVHVTDYGVGQDCYTLSGNSEHFYCAHNLELVTEVSPVREVPAHKEIVPGVYGRFKISPQDSQVSVRFVGRHDNEPYGPAFLMDAGELRKAATLFTQLAGVLDDADA